MNEHYEYHEEIRALKSRIYELERKNEALATCIAKKDDALMPAGSIFAEAPTTGAQSSDFERGCPLTKEQIRKMQSALALTPTAAVDQIAQLEEEIHLIENDRLAQESKYLAELSLREQAEAELAKLKAEVKSYNDAFDAQPWATDEPARVQLDRITAKLKAEREWLSGRLTNAGTMQVNDETLTGVFIEVSKEKLSGVSALPMYETILMQPLPSAPEAKEG